MGQVYMGRFADAVEALFGSELIKAATTPDGAPLFGSRPPRGSEDRPRDERDNGDQNQKLDRTDSWHGPVWRSRAREPDRWPRPTSSAIASLRRFTSAALTFGTDWAVRHDGDQVLLSDVTHYTETKTRFDVEARLPFSEYRDLVEGFARAARDFYFADGARQIEDHEKTASRQRLRRALIGGQHRLPRFVAGLTCLVGEWSIACTSIHRRLPAAA